MFSMTGYGRGEYKQGGIELVAEIKTVNNRYLDVAVKCPKIFLAYEEVIRSAVREGITRGHADVFISFTDKREKAKTLFVDEALANAYVAASQKLAKACGFTKNDYTVQCLMRQPDIVRQEEVSGADEELIAALKSALGLALQNLNAMREREGAKLAADMLSRVDKVEAIVGQIVLRAPLVAEDYKQRLREKIENYLQAVNPDESRLLTEVALFADKCNIDEELTRLKSHIAQFREISAQSQVGRKLDFLIQEFNRESNTICSKSNDLTVTKLGLELKNEIEKIREQVQNVE